jgi:uncharacterized protein YjiS (DUF1127 family)
MTSHTVTTRSVTASNASYRSWPMRLLDRLHTAQALHRQHVALTNLDDALLRDIGITREQAVAEAGKPVWDVPNHWRG